jgi:hypothetical protein
MVRDDKCGDCDWLNKHGLCKNRTLCDSQSEYKAPDELTFDDEKQRVIGKEGGMKNDADKPQWSLLPFDIIEILVKVLTYGARKYEPHNWKKVEIERNFDAMMRHINAWRNGEDYDKSGFHHLDHAFCDLMFILWKIKHEDE